MATAKYFKATKEGLMKHISSNGDAHMLKVDFGNGQYGIWCEDCETEVGSYCGTYTK